MAVTAPFSGSLYSTGFINQATHPLDRGGLLRVAIVPLAAGTGIKAKISDDGGVTWSSEVSVPTSGSVTGTAVWWGIEWDRQGVLKIWNEDMTKSYKCVAWPTWVAN